ncbi:MAG: P-II family nitrogen regulator [Planctomycetes bacterium]|nr:P-II family nitrogen regulator [Planctomycetota bacterium]MCL4731272.1 P-II family nitrogen regulator [Planctomycetota bacterium]
MKLVQVIIAPEKLEAVKDALARAEVYRFTISEVLGTGHQRDRAEVANSALDIEMFRKLKLEIAVNDSFIQPTIDAVMQAAGEDSVGVGKVLVLKLDDVIRIRTGEHGSEAI